MKNNILLIILLLTTCNYALADTDAATEMQIDQQIKALNTAMIDADTKALQKLTAKELSYGHSSGRVENQAQFIENLRNGSSDFVSIELQEQQIDLAEDIAIVRHILSAKTNDGGKAGQVKIGVMLVWKLYGENGWKLLARQAYKL